MIDNRNLDFVQCRRLPVSQIPTSECDILLTGATGRLGPLLCRAWTATAAAPTVATLARSGAAQFRWTPGAPFDHLPRCGAVVALWGVTSGTAAHLAANSDLARAALDLARGLGARTVLHMSSAGVYGPGADMDEATPPHPVTDYGRAKLAMEQHVAGFDPADGVAHSCLRLANVVGADSLAPALHGDRRLRLDRFRDGAGPRRSYIAPGLLARVLARLAALPAAALPPVVNVAARRPVGMADLARAAGCPIEWTPAPDTAVQTVTLNTDRLAGLLPSLDLNADAEMMIDDMRRAGARG